MSANKAYKPRLQDEYENRIKKAVQEAMGYKNPEERGGENAEVLVDPAKLLKPNLIYVYPKNQIKEKGFIGKPVPTAIYDALDTFNNINAIATGLSKPEKGSISSATKDFKREFDNMQFQIKTRSKGELANFWKIGL